MANLGGENALGQLGSSFSKADSGVMKPPTNMVICAITFLGADGVLDSLKPQAKTVGTPIECFSTQYAAHNESSGNATISQGEGGQAITADTTKFPQGITIFGRWDSVSLSADATPASGGILCYFSY